MVANDWGVVGLLQRYPELDAVAGRVLHAQLRDPRVTQVDADRLGGGLPRTWRLGAAVSASWRQLIRESGIQRVELDWPPQGLDEDAWTHLDVALSLHLPQVLVASGRSCVHRDPRGALDRLTVREACSKRCLADVVELRPPWTAVVGSRMERRGNAELYELDPTTRDHALAWVQRGGPDRVIVGGG